MHLGYPELATSATQSTMILAAHVLPDFPEDNQTESQPVEYRWPSTLLRAWLTSTFRNPHPTSSWNPRSVPHPCHLRLSDTTGSLLQAPAASASLLHYPFSDFFHCQRSWVHQSLALPCGQLTARPTDLTGSWLTDVAAFTAGAGLTTGAKTELTAAAARTGVTITWLPSLGPNWLGSATPSASCWTAAFQNGCTGQLPSVGRSAPKISASALPTAAEAQREAPTSHRYALH
jgi:hypothetical protein